MVKSLDDVFREKIMFMKYLKPLIIASSYNYEEFAEKSLFITRGALTRCMDPKNGELCSFERILNIRDRFIEEFGYDDLLMSVVEKIADVNFIPNEDVDALIFNCVNRYAKTKGPGGHKPRELEEEMRGYLKRLITIRYETYSNNEEEDYYE